MPSVPAIAGIVAVVIYLVSGIPYYFGMIWNEETRPRWTRWVWPRGLESSEPSPTSWWIWGINGGVLAAAHIAAGGEDSIWLPLLYAIEPLVLAVLITKHRPKWSRFDKSCLAGAAVALALWGIFKSPVPATLCSIAVDTIAMAPTIRKVWRREGDEPTSAWLMAFAANLINLVAVQEWSFGIAAYPVFLTVLTGSGTLLSRRKAEVVPRQGA